MQALKEHLHPFLTLKRHIKSFVMQHPNLLHALLKLHLLFCFTIRYPYYRLRGHQLVNPYGKFWRFFPRDKMHRALIEILREAHIQLPFDTTLDLGCGDGTHYAPILKQFSQRVIGVDIIDSKEVKVVDQYIQVPLEAQAEYLQTLEDESLDAVFVLSLIGFASHSTWKHYAHVPEWRSGRYFTPANFPRVIKKNGYLIMMEWEAYPERRFNKSVTFKDKAHMIDSYQPVEIPGFQRMACGFSSQKNGPYVIYQKC